MSRWNYSTGKENFHYFVFFITFRYCVKKEKYNKIFKKYMYSGEFVQMKLKHAYEDFKQTFKYKKFFQPIKLMVYV